MSTHAEPNAPSPARVLVVDDDPTIRALLSRILRAAGHEVVLAEDGVQALRLLDDGAFELILSDISMPNIDGMTLLKTVREKNEDIPVVLLAGAPSTDTAIGAVRYHATDYLPKPVEPEQLLLVVDHAIRLNRLARVRREVLSLHQERAHQAGDETKLAVSFDRALAALFMVYQPIVDWSQRVVFGYEALVRSSETSLPHPGALFDAAEKLDRLTDLGRIIRDKCGEPLALAEPDTSLFVNLHTRDLLDPQLYEPSSALAKIARRVVLEITERANIEQVDDIRARIAQLRALGFRIAIDDIGAGYSGLNSFAVIQPDIVKLDITLVRGIHVDPVKQKLVHVLMGLCNDLGISVVAEGVETSEERDALLLLGANVFQGYLFARPGAPFPDPKY